MKQRLRKSMVLARAALTTGGATVVIATPAAAAQTSAAALLAENAPPSNAPQDQIGGTNSGDNGVAAAPRTYGATIGFDI